MIYEFPIIETINDVLPHIEGRNEFIVADRGDHIIINYAVAFHNTFGSVENGFLDPVYAIRRECRGLIFDKTDGKIIRRPFPKFFNLGEKDETQPSVVESILDNDTVSLEKLDGSMIAPFTINRELRWGTKMAVTDVSLLVMPFLEHNPNYITFARAWDAYGFTTIFEFCSRSQRIVVDYPEDRLVLTAMRSKRTGAYVPYQPMVEYAEAFGVEVVQTMEFNQSCRDSEGVVLRTNQGHMIKMKTDHYVRLHKTKDKISVEKNAVDAILNNEIDDLLPNLSQEDQDRVNNLSDALHSFLLERSNVLEESVRNDVQTWKDRKSYALDCFWPQYEKAATFKLWDNPTGAYNYLMDQLVKSLGKEVNYNSFKQTWGFDYAY